jgi:hypothetical protein
MSDDRKCDLKSDCRCPVARRPGCLHFHMPCPSIVQSKQDRLRVTRSAWDKKRDKMMREAERRLDKLKPQSETEERLRDIRHNPIRHLERTGRRPSRRQRVADQQ